MMPRDPPLRHSLYVLRAFTCEGTIRRQCRLVVFELDHWFNMSIMMAMDNWDTVRLMQQKNMRQKRSMYIFTFLSWKEPTPIQDSPTRRVFCCSRMVILLRFSVTWVALVFICIYRGKWQCTKVTTSGQQIYKLLPPALFYNFIPTWHAFCSS